MDRHEYRIVKKYAQRSRIQHSKPANLVDVQNSRGTTLHPIDLQRPKFAHLVEVKDSRGITLHPGIELRAVRRFSGVASKKLPSHLTAEEGERFELTFTSHGSKNFSSFAGFHIMKWMDTQYSLDFAAPLRPISREGQHNASQLLNLAAVARAMDLLPRTIPTGLEDMAIDKIADLARSGNLTLQIMDLAVDLYSPGARFLKSIAGVLAVEVHSGKADHAQVATAVHALSAPGPEVKAHFYFVLRSLKKDQTVGKEPGQAGQHASGKAEVGTSSPKGDSSDKHQQISQESWQDLFGSTAERPHHYQ